MNLTAILAYIVTQFRALVPLRSTVDYESQAKALIAKIDADATEARNRAEALTEAAASILVSAENERVFARRASGLAGRLDGALEV